MKAWIFQGNPDHFDVDGYLEQCNSTIVWLVRQHASEVGVGDTVFLWRSQGDGKQPGGVIAELEVVEPVRAQSDDPKSLPFWKVSPGDAEKKTGEMPRVRLRLLRLASKREVLKRDWLIDDPVLQSLSILRMAHSTNYSVTPAQETRIRALWANTGRDWNRAEDVAALYAYDQTFGQPISKNEGSLVSNIALQIGRVTSGVYNKLMNFRSLDPRATQKGLEGSSNIDLVTWQEFFDEGIASLDSIALRQEYERLWAVSESTPVTVPAGDTVAAEAARLEHQGLQALLDGFNASRSESQKPVRQIGTVSTYRRDPRVVAITRLRAKYTCEVEGCGNHQFVGGDSHPYVETHHLHTLAEGGSDDPTNTVAVCAIHHRELHHGQGREQLRSQLTRKRSDE